MEPKRFIRFKQFFDYWLGLILISGVLLGCCLTVSRLFSIPGSLSIFRVILVSIPVLIGLSCLLVISLILTRKICVSKLLLTNTILINRSEWVTRILFITWIILLIFAYLPIDKLGYFNAIYLRLNPIFRLFLLIVSITGFYWFYLTQITGKTRTLFKNKEFKASLIQISLVVFIWTLIAFTGKGIGQGSAYWGKAGVPILHWQLAVGIILAIIWLWIENRLTKSKNLWTKDTLIFLSLWTSAILIWHFQPVSLSHFTVPKYPPNFDNYPYSDAGDYAIQAEAIRVGNGFAFGYIDKPLHLTFLTFLSWLAGSDFSKMMMIQSALLAIIPSLIFVLTSRLSSRSAGVLAGTLSVFMQNNSLTVPDHIQTINVKMAMSEPLTGFMLILVSLVMILWWNNPQKSLAYPAFAGALLGLAGLVRLNVIIIFPIIFVAWILKFGIKKRKTWAAGLIFLVFFLFAFVPWGIRNQVVYNDFFNSFVSKIDGVILKKRILPVINPGVLQITSENSPSNLDENPGEIKLDHNSSDRWLNLIDSMIHTSFHNLVAISFTLPASPIHDGLEDTIRQPYWDLEWNGTFIPGGIIVFSVSILLLIMGISTAWSRNGLIGLIPLLILFSYLLANILSFVSGGRYIVPIEWILPSYFSIGIVWLIKSILKLKSTQTTEFLLKSDVKKSFLWIAVVIVIVICSIPTILSLSIPPKYSPKNNSVVVNEIKSSGLSLPDDMSLEDLVIFSSQKDAVFKKATAMFPRWMRSGESDTGGSGSAFSALPFDHLSLTYFSDDLYPSDAILPINTQVDYFPNGSDVILIGCRSQAYLDAVIIMITGSEPRTYVRQNTSELTCPLPQP